MSIRISLTVFIAMITLSICSAGQIDVYLLGGQSNMEGNGAVADIEKEVPNVIPNAFFIRSDQVMGPLTLGKTAKKKKVLSFGPEVGFALEMASKDRPVYILKYSASGMPLHSGWSKSKWRGTTVIEPGENFYPGLHAEDKNQGTHYKAMLALYEESIEFLKREGHTPVLRGFVWMQGEQDAKQEDSAKVYATSLKNLRSRLCADLGLGDQVLPLAFGLVVPNEPVPKRFPAYKTMHVQMAAADQDSGTPEAMRNCKMVSTVGFSMKSDMVHFDAQGQLALGRSLAKAIKELNQGK